MSGKLDPLFQIRLVMSSDQTHNEQWTKVVDEKMMIQGSR